MFRLTWWFLTACLALPVLASASGQNRVALVIGNDSYRHVTPLKNAKMDARAIAKEMERAGFTVNLKLDVDEKAMKDAIRTFKGQVLGGDVAVFYFSGHGVQLGGANYLLPVDIRGESEDQIKDEAVALQRVLDDLQEQKARFSLAIVDACNNPFKGAGRSLGGRGLAVTSAATGQMVLFSAGAGQQALDTLGPHDKNPNGLFTRVLLKEMDRPGVPVDKVLRNVRDEVVKLSQGAGQEQVPALYDQALGEFYFFPARNEAIPAPVAAPEVAATAPSGLGAPPVASSLLGGLQVAVNVPDAQIFLNGNLVGTASPTKALNLRDLPVGAASVRVEAQGYAPRTQAFEILEGQWTQAKIVLSKPGEAQAPPSRTIWSKLNPTSWIGSKPAPGTDGTPLSEAAMKGDAAKLQTLLDAGGSPGNFDKWGWTPLHWAVYYNKLEAVTFLLKHGADPNLQVTKSYRSIKPGSTPLMVAAYYGNEDAITALLNRPVSCSCG